MDEKREILDLNGLRRNAEFLFILMALPEFRIPPSGSPRFSSPLLPPPSPSPPTLHCVVASLIFK